MGNVFEWLQESSLYCLTNNLFCSREQGLLHRTSAGNPAHKHTGTGGKKQNCWACPLSDQHCAMDTAAQVADVRARLRSYANAETEQLQNRVTTVNVSLETLLQRTSFLEDELDTHRRKAT